MFGARAPPLPLRSTSKGRRKQDVVRATPRNRGPSAKSPEFSAETLGELLRALRARAVDHPTSPGLIASWPGVPAERMPAACAELRRQGHAVHEVAIVGVRDKVRRGWAMEANRDAAAPAAPPVRLAEALAVLVRGVAEPRTVSLARSVLVEVAEREGVPLAVRSAVALAVTEACANVVRHAYVDADAPGNVEVRAGKSGTVLIVEVADDGRGMLPRADYPGLGFGLPLIAEMADIVEIRSHRGRRGLVVRMQFNLDEEGT